MLHVTDKQMEPAGMGNLSWWISHPSAVIPPNVWVRERHRGRWNVLSCDGHVVTMQIKGLFGFRVDEVRRLWNKDDQPHREFAPPPGP